MKPMECPKCGRRIPCDCGFTMQEVRAAVAEAEVRARAEEHEACLSDMADAMGEVQKRDGFGNPVPPAATAGDLQEATVRRIHARGRS